MVAGHNWPSIDIIREQVIAGSKSFTLSPELWATCILPTNLEWKLVRFTDDNAVSVPTHKAGVYCFVLRPKVVGPPAAAYLLYIGKTTQFRTRYRRYLRDRTASRARPHIHEMLNKWSDEHVWFYYAPIADLDVVRPVEKILIDSCIPPFNVEFSGEVNTAVNLWRNLGGFKALP